MQVTLADQQQDPNSPLFSAKSFEDLNLCAFSSLHASYEGAHFAFLPCGQRHPNLLKGIYKMGFQKPSKIQERALPLLLQNPCVRLAVPFRPLISRVPFHSQPAEHDWAISVGDGQDGRFRSHDALSDRYGPPPDSGVLLPDDAAGPPGKPKRS